MFSPKAGLLVFVLLNICITISFSQHVSVSSTGVFHRHLIEAVSNNRALAAAPSPIEESSSPSLSPSSSSVGCCLEDMMNRPGANVCSCVYPIEIGLLLENVSTNFINSSTQFQHQLASQLKMFDSQVVITGFFYISTNTLNMTIYLGPLVGPSFSYQEAANIKEELDVYGVHFSLVGNYSLVSFQLFEPPAPTPVSESPAPAHAPVPLTGSSLIPGGQNAQTLKSRQKNNLNLGLILGVGFTVLSVLGISVLLFRRCAPTAKDVEERSSLTGKDVGKMAASVSLIDTSIPRPSSTRMFSYEDLKEATNGFDPSNLIGEGGFGRVYSGSLKDGTPVAIKKLSTGGHQGDKEFLVEVEMLSRLHHRHLVKLIGFYTSRDSSHQLLCYELVSNGSLESWLHGKLGVNTPLDWDTRMKIAIGAARGLAYLHEDSQPCVIHRDFKASNILLENNFQAKVSDFGLAKLAPEGQCNYLSTRVMGTFGYVAPEYAMTGHLLVKSDVYSYGVVLLELLSGKRPVDMTQPSGQESLVTWARPLLKDPEHLFELADPRLEDKFPKEDFAQVCAIAAACVAPEANQRPTMGEVVQSLKMVQRSNDYTLMMSGEREETPTSTRSDRTLATSCWQNNTRPTSTTFESDGSASSIFSSGPFSGLGALEEVEHLNSRDGAVSEDLLEGR